MEITIGNCYEGLRTSRTIKSSGQIEVTDLDLTEIPIGSSVRVIVLVEDDEDTESPAESFRQGWADVVAGNTIPVSKLWE